ncbi:MAG: uroporphyrinogen-III synthase [Sulfurovum sp.]|nr:uroporphyrinogen-III synthase [Sulfurovum sp.]
MIYLLSPEAHENCIHLPMIKFQMLKKDIIFDAYDLLIFTSKQAVICIEKINNHWKNTPCIAIGNATAQLIEKLGGTVLYKSEKFYAKTLNEEIVKNFKNKNILYLRPKVISFDSQEFLASKDIELKEKIIYETSCITYSEEKRPKKNAIIIFTSPSTIKCFLNNFGWDESYRAVVIGEVTKKHLPKNAWVLVADEPSIESCIKKAKSLI